MAEQINEPLHITQAGTKGGIIYVLGPADA